MPEILKILLLEDRLEDALLIERQLKNEKTQFVVERVQDRESFNTAIATEPILVLADYKLPGFSGLEALQLLRTKYPHAPFILISGQIGEELAADAIKQGADDYLLKDRLVRLLPAINSALEKKRNFQERERLDQEVREQTAFIETVLNNLGDGVLTLLENGSISSINLAAQNLFRYQTPQIIGKHFKTLIARNSQDQFQSSFGRFVLRDDITGGKRAVNETVGQRKDGTTFPMEIRINEMTLRSERRFVIVIQDPVRQRLSTRLQLKKEAVS
jgi:PAS domain S-box-containing protein